MILDGKNTAKKINERLREEIKSFNTPPKLVVILVGNDEASRIYVSIKGKKTKEIGANFELLHLSSETTQEDLLTTIKEINLNPNIDGLLVQLPLPQHINEDIILQAIDKTKDIDGIHPENLHALMNGKEIICPCTPLGIIKLLDAYDISVKGKKVVVLGYSKIVGMPMVGMLNNRGATVEVCTRETEDVTSKTKYADILISATGVAKMITRDMVKEGAIVIDVGMNKDQNGKLCGDVDFEDVKEKTSYITPVPGGVGPMTVAMVVENLVNIYRKIKKKSYRDLVKTSIDNISAEEKKVREDELKKKIIALDEFKNANRIFCYYPLKDEISTISFIKECLRIKKEIYLPNSHKNAIGFYKINDVKDLKKSKLGVYEPQRGVEEKKGDLIIVPGRVFDKKNNRIGRGLGYYDRYLSRQDISLSIIIGVCYKEQVLEKSIEIISPLDVPMDKVLFV